MTPMLEPDQIGLVLDVAHTTVLRRDITGPRISVADWLVWKSLCSWHYVKGVGFGLDPDDKLMLTPLGVRALGEFIKENSLVGNPRNETMTEPKRTTLTFWVAIDQDGAFSVNGEGADEAGEQLGDDHGRNDGCVDIYRVDMDVPVPATKKIRVVADAGASPLQAGAFKISVE